MTHRINNHTEILLDCVYFSPPGFVKHFRMVLVQQQTMKKAPGRGKLLTANAHSVQNKVLTGLILNETEELRNFET